MILRCLFAGMIAIASIAPAQALERGDQLVRAVQEPFLGDFDEMKQDKVVRALISYSLTDYFISDGEEHGLAVEFLRAFDTHINKGIKKETDKIAVVLIPTRRDRLLPDLVEGKGDMVVANLTVTPDRLESVDFADPLHTGVNEVLVTAAAGEKPMSVEDMAGMDIHVRASSSYFESLVQLNEDPGGEESGPN
ncbi:transporter substrate-binding domain-containing protein [Roseibium alexandrii]|uniref:transporter substrate-binding domain-containing protein n=1 Tax=Roseibium alexandrii TaxID=388408 RepID=UPI00374FDC2B